MNAAQQAPGVAEQTAFTSTTILPLVNDDAPCCLIALLT
jgi:hypothetical protein